MAAELNLEREILAIVYTCGKALASVGAFVCCDAKLKDFLINRARTFLFSTAMPPYIARQIHAALKIARDENSRRKHLNEISSALREGLSAAGLNYGASSTHIVPVILGTNETALRVAAQLQSAGFAVRAIRPPTVPAARRAFAFRSPAASLLRTFIVSLARSTLRCIRATFQRPKRRRSRMPNRFFITGTDTDVGKTVVSALLCAALGAIYWKPIQTGTREGTRSRHSDAHRARAEKSHVAGSVSLCAARVAASGRASRGRAHRAAKNQIAANRAILKI